MANFVIGVSLQALHVEWVKNEVEVVLSLSGSLFRLYRLPSRGGEELVVAVRLAASGNSLGLFFVSCPNIFPAIVFTFSRSS